jgi:uncharacterized protein (DUF2147 family)
MAFLRPAALRAFAAASAIFAVFPAIARAGDASPLGVWIDNTGRGAVEIKQCGGSTLCGHVVWVRNSKDIKGCGRQIIGAARPIGSKGMHQGWIYSPEKKQRYDVEFVPSGADKLRVTGYAGIKLFSRTMYWTRASSDLVRCDSTQTAQTAPKPSEQAAAATAAPQKPEAPKEQAKPTQSAPSALPKKTVTPAEDATPANTSAKETAEKNASSQQDTASVKSEDAVTDSSAADEQTAENDAATASEETAGSGLSKLNLGGMQLGKVISRKGGTCKLDLPWVKVRFDCKDL